MPDIITMRTYEQLSHLYDLHWGTFAMQYVSLINRLLDERGVKQARILDLACGTGTLAVELAKDGHFVHGIDLSLEMIDIARSKSIGLYNVSFDVQNMTHFSVEGKFDLSACTFDSINYLVNIDDLQVMLHYVARILGRSGMFIFDSNNEKLYACRHHGIFEHTLNGESVIQRLKYDPVKKEAETVFKFSVR